jgi:nitrite reductase/ring-hydroxylating ferredoxin subunit
MTPPRPQDAGLSPNGLLLGGVVLVFAAAALGAVTLYLLPPPDVNIPELQPVIRVAAEADMPVGSSRVVNWGDHVVLVVRSAERRYVALEGTSPLDGCVLRWDEAALRVVSPCSHLVYDLHGNVVQGLTREPLRLYAAFARAGVVYVGRL